MPTTRSYRDACPIARALDRIGERWALLIVRELLLGAQRFSDLRRALPRASSNMLTDRLRELEAHGVVRRRRLPPPAASVIYELTPRGHDLEPVLEALGAWGSVEAPPAPASLSATAVLLFLRTLARAHATPPPHTYRLQLDDRVWQVVTVEGSLEIQPHEPTTPIASLQTDPATLNALLLDPSGLDSAIADAKVRVDGSVAAVRDLIEVATPPPMLT